MGLWAAVCADKGSPGASTLALVLAAAHPRSTILVEADPAGGDLAPRLFAGTGGPQGVGANLLTLAGDGRRGAHPYLLSAHATMTPVGVSLVEGLGTADQQAGLGPLWPSLTAALTASEHEVIADLGRVSSLHPGLAVAAAAHHIVVVVRPVLEELLRLRDRVRHLLGVAGGTPLRLVVVVVSAEKTAQRDQRAAATVLAEAGLPGVAVEWFCFNPKELAAFYAGRPVRRGYLWRSALGLIARLDAGWGARTSTGPTAAVAAHGANFVGEGAWTTS